MRKFLRTIVVLVLALTVIFSIGGCSIKGKTYEFKEVNVKWKDSVTKFEKDFILENGYGDEDDFNNKKELFEYVAKEIEEDFEKYIVEFSSNGKEISVYYNAKAYKNEEPSGKYDVEKDGKNIYLIYESEISDYSYISMKGKVGLTTVTLIEEYEYFDVEIVFKKMK